MFGRKKAAKKREQEVAELFALQETYTKQIEDKFKALEKIKDPAEKIIKLQQLIGIIRSANNSAYSKQVGIAHRRADKKLNKVAGGGIVTAAAAVAIPAAILAPPFALFAIPAAAAGLLPEILMEGSAYEKKRKQLLEQNPKLNDFAEAMAAQETRAVKILTETIKTADLKEISLSPHFKEVFGSNDVLRNRFAEAATKAAKDELEEKPAPAKKATPQKRQPPKYDDLKGI